jgi:hypothetical protein
MNDKSPIADLVEALKDADYRRSWQANIAMAFYDAYRQYPNEDLHKVANIAADHFLNLLCHDDKLTTKLDISDALWQARDPFGIEKQLEAENAKLRAVVEAVKKLRVITSEEALDGRPFWVVPCDSYEPLKIAMDEWGKIK